MFPSADKGIWAWEARSESGSASKFRQGKEKAPELQKFLATARSVFLLLAVFAGGAILLLSPWLPEWWFPKEHEAGSLQPYFAVGAVAFASAILVRLSGQPELRLRQCPVARILPAFILLQFCMLAHWVLAWQGAPLWIQYIPYVIITVSGIVADAALRARLASRPGPRLLSLKFDRRMAASLFENSFWLYLCTLGNLLYKNTDIMAITAGAPNTASLN